MNAVEENEEEAQVNTIYRCRHWFERNDYRSLRPNILNEQFALAELALQEETKFLNLLGQDEWPLNMEVVKDNLLRTTVRDEELSSNEGNTTDIMPALWKSFVRLYPGRARGIEEEKKRIEDNSSSDDEAEPDSTTPDKPDTEAEALTAADIQRRAEEEAERKEAERQAKLRCTADTFLQELSLIHI